MQSQLVVVGGAECERFLLLTPAKAKGKRKLAVTAGMKCSLKKDSDASWGKG